MAHFFNQPPVAATGYSDTMFRQLQEGPIPIEILRVMFAEGVDKYSKQFAIIRATSGITSTIASSTLIWMILRSNVGLSTPYHRLLLGLCIVDLSYSLSMSLFNVMVPSETDYFTWNAKGSMQTCSVQGFFWAIGISGSLCYNCALNLYYLAVVKYEKRDAYIRSKLEPFLHGVPIVVALVYSIGMLAGQHLNPDAGGTCSKTVYEPFHCIGMEDGDLRDEDDFVQEIPCGRGRSGSGAFNIFGFVLVLSPPFVIGTSLFLIYRAVLKQEMKMSVYGVGALKLKTQQSTTVGRTSSSSQSRVVLRRAVAYSCSYLLSFIMLITLFFIRLTGQTFNLPIAYLVSIFNPLQGLWNFMIYIYPKVMKEREKKVSWFRAFWSALWSKGAPKGRKGSATALRNARSSRPRSSIPRESRKKSRYPSAVVAEEEKHEIESPENVVYKSRRSKKLQVSFHVSNIDGSCSGHPHPNGNLETSDHSRPTDKSSEKCVEMVGDKHETSIGLGSGTGSGIESNDEDKTKSHNPKDIESSPEKALDSAAIDIEGVEEMEDPCEIENVVDNELKSQDSNHSSPEIPSDDNDASIESVEKGDGGEILQKQ